MLIPRNTLVVLELIEQKERKVGKIVMPNNADQYGEASVIAIGPGTQVMPDARPETFDLKVGQRVLVKHQDVQMAPGGQGLVKRKLGVEYREGDRNYILCEQFSIIAILAEAVSPLFEQTPKLVQ